MLKSKSALFISLVLATQLAAASSVMVEQQVSAASDTTENGSVILEKGIIVQKPLAGGLIIDKSPALNRGGGVILEQGAGLPMAGGVILERQGVVIIERELAGSVIIERYASGV
jgi:hypothetical protein